MSRWDRSAQRIVRRGAGGVTVDILSGSNLTEQALDVPATFTSTSYQRQVLEGAAVQINIATADLGVVVLNSGKYIRLNKSDAQVYPFSPTSGGGVQPPVGVPGGVVVSGTIRAGA